jgi:opacity protein-like surface antigen
MATAQSATVSREGGAAPVTTSATETRREHGWSASHPFAIGNRLTGRAGQYLLGGGGGHVRLRLHRWVGIELFTDHLFGPVDGALRHDHEIGGLLQLPFLGNRWWNLYPMIGACASFVVLESPRQGGSSVQDVHFGVHLGAGAEIYLDDHWALQSHIEAIGYVGHELRAYNWTAQLSPDVRFTAVAQGVLSINYYF